MSHWSEALPKTACREAVEWAKTQPDYETAWVRCERADWMLWLISKYDDSAPMSYERRKIARCVLDIVGAVRHRMSPKGVECIDLLARWCDGADVTHTEMRAAAAAAADAAHAAAGAARAAADAGAARAARAAAAAAAADAAHAAAGAARAAVAWDAYSAAADAAADAAHAAAGAARAARAASLRSGAEIVRRHYPTGPVLR